MSIFKFDKKATGASALLPLVKNAIVRTKTLRCPHTLEFIGVHETDAATLLVTERVQPLSDVLERMAATNTDLNESAGAMAPGKSEYTETSSITAAASATTPQSRSCSNLNTGSNTGAKALLVRDGSRR